MKLYFYTVLWDCFLLLFVHNFSSRLFFFTNKFSDYKDKYF